MRAPRWWCCCPSDGAADAGTLPLRGVVGAGRRPGPPGALRGGAGRTRHHRRTTHPSTQAPPDAPTTPALTHSVPSHPPIPIPQRPPPERQHLTSAPLNPTDTPTSHPGKLHYTRSTCAHQKHAGQKPPAHASPHPERPSATTKPPHKTEKPLPLATPPTQKHQATTGAGRHAGGSAPVRGHPRECREQYFVNKYRGCECWAGSAPRPARLLPGAQRARPSSLR